MAVKPPQNPPAPAACVQTVEEIMHLYKSLPPRPTIEEVEAATVVLESLAEEEKIKLDNISKNQKPEDVPEELFDISQEVKRNMVVFQSQEQKKEAFSLVDLDKFYISLDILIQKASVLVSSDPHDQENGFLIKKSKDDLGVQLLHSSSTKTANLFSGNNENENEKYNLLKVAGIIEELYAENEEEGVLDFGGKLMDRIEWLPASIGKLSRITELNISDNLLMALPDAIGNMKALTKFDAHANQLINLPEAFGELVNLIKVDLHSNRLKSLPASFEKLGNLADLNLSSNMFVTLPETVGSLKSLRILDVESNELEELPYSIASCSVLEELRLDFNKLKALPEGTGNIESLRVVKLHYNKIKGLPTTIGNLLNLQELDVSFNELELVPDQLCYATNLVKLNVSSNFADLRALPNSIGNLELLQELDISCNQIRYLPESFRFLSNLKKFTADETPLELPPTEVIKLGAQEVVQYMADLVAMKDVKVKPSTKKNGIWFWLCGLFRPKKASTPQGSNV